MHGVDHVKHLIRYVISSLVLAGMTSQINAVDTTSGEHADDRAYSAAEDLSPPKSNGSRPFSFEITGDAFAKTKLKRRHNHNNNHQHNRFQYAEAFAELGMIYYYNPCHKEALSATVDYSFVDFDWKTNPYFGQQYFHTASLALGGYTERFANWIIKGQAAMNIDANTWNFNQYMTLDFILWGRYQYCRNIGLNIGVLVETGMKIDRVYPIVGVDWQVTRKFKLNLVYPVDLTAIYQFNCNWNVAAAGRLITSRHRASKDMDVHKSLFVYRTAGVEAAVNYDNLKWVNANIHIGYSLGGRLTIANQHYKAKQHYNVDSTGYIGGELAFKF